MSLVAQRDLTRRRRRHLLADPSIGPSRRPRSSSARHAALGLALLLALALAVAAAQSPAPAGRSVHGVVLDARDQPIPAAIVYLKDMRTQAIRTYIATNEGKYVFHALEPNTDYQLFAEFRQQRSPTRTVSAFDTRVDTPLDLKIPIE